MTNSDGTDDRYRRKIKTRDELLAIIGARPRARSVIMCHGAFDLVHHGHLRHLMYARGKADILVASLTADAFISKAHYRPFVPQQLRAMHLAALEVVDYVIIDEHPTPLENLAVLQPDYFAKGAEYVAAGIHPKTQDEIAVLQTYGGELIATPGDVVYSSSRWIESMPPKLGAEKLLALLQSEGLDFAEVRGAIDRCQGLRVDVLGDTIVDSYVYCTPLGSSTSKTPTLSVARQSQMDFAGGAAVVAGHLKAAGADVTFSTVLGDDARKDFVLAELASHGVRCNPVIDPTRPTTTKTVYIADGYRLLKVDELDNRPISAASVERFAADLAEGKAHAYVLSDFRHGIFNRDSIPLLSRSMRSGALRVADSQVASRWGNILEFQGFDLITPNEKEARFALGDQDSEVRALALELRKQSACKALILKLREHGMIAADARSLFQLDAFASRVVDALGAGDAMLAYATVSLAATGNLVIASILGSLAAAVACEHEGNTPVTPDQVREKLAAVETRLRYA